MGVSHVGPGVEVVPASALELTAEYFGNTRLEGEPIVRREEKLIDYDSASGRVPDGVPAELWSARWTGTLKVRESGHYEIGFTGDDGYRVSLGDATLVEDWSDHGARTTTAAVDLEAGKAYVLKVEFYQSRGGAAARLVWSRPGLAQERRAEALAVARKADVVIAVMGLSPELEGEEMKTEEEGFLGGDRTAIGLPEGQLDLLKTLHGEGKPVVLVLLNGSPLAVNWAGEKLPAIVEAWYPGQQGGQAVADVLFGDVNPAGRLPVTFYRGVDDLPPFTDYSMEGRTYRYYRGQPLFPFGYGLSYTRFTYGPATLAREEIARDEDAEVSVVVENAGQLAGDEVVQLYVTALEPGPLRAPIRALAGFRRVHLEAGEKKEVRFTLTPEQRRLWDLAGEPVAMTGRVRLSVGGKQPGFEGLADAATTGASEVELVVADR
jgi:beta-glucosidase